MSDPFVAEIRAVSFNFAPTGWATCDGQLLPISQNTALFSLLGTNYGGDGKSTFGLPNLQGSVAIGTGLGPGLTPRNTGDIGGEQNVTLQQSEMPQHNHTAKGGTTPGLLTTPANNSFTVPATGKAFGTTADPQDFAAPLGAAGSGFPHNNMQPYLTLNYIIAMQGVFPQRQ